MRRLLALGLVFAYCWAPGQVWEKYVAPGLTYRMEVEPSLPRTIHALHFDLRSDGVHPKSELGQLKVYNDDATKGRATISDLVKKTGALAGINASFFPYTGRPIGLMVRSGELISSPVPLRPEFGWGPEGVADFALSKFSAQLRIGDDAALDFDGINDEAKPDWLCLDTDAAGYAFTKQGVGSCAIVKISEGAFTPDCNIDGVVDQVTQGVSKLAIPKGTAVIMATGSKEPLVDGLKQGDRIKLTLHTDGFDWDRIQNCVCGGPTLLRRGQLVLDWQQEGFNAEFSLKRHPRSAVGIDSHGGLWLVAVDGRQSESVGATLEELAAIMLHLGCTDAMNLDGGGSTTLTILGVTVNRPSDGVERPVANAILFFGPTENAEQTHFSLANPGALDNGSKVQLRVLKADGEEVPSAEVFWAASGAAWVDQGGFLTVDKLGAISVSAFVHGETLTAFWLTTTPAPPAPSRR